MESDYLEPSRYLEKPKDALVGELFKIEFDYYEDFGSSETFRVLKTFSPMGKLEEYLAQRPNQRKPMKFRYKNFLEFLEDEALIEKMPKLTVMHLIDELTACVDSIR